MSYFKNIDEEIIKLDFDGLSVSQIAEKINLSVKQVQDILDDAYLDQFVDLQYAEDAADADAEYYANVI